MKLDRDTQRDNRRAAASTKNPRQSLIALRALPVLSLLVAAAGCTSSGPHPETVDKEAAAVQRNAPFALGSNARSKPAEAFESTPAATLLAALQKETPTLQHAEIAWLAEVDSIGESPRLWSGYLESFQWVRYRNLRPLRGAMPHASPEVEFALLPESPYIRPEVPEVEPRFFFPGAVHLFYVSPSVATDGFYRIRAMDTDGVCLRVLVDE